MDEERHGFFGCGNEIIWIIVIIIIIWLLFPHIFGGIGGCYKD